MEMFQETQKSQFYFSRDHGIEVTVKNVEITNEIMIKGYGQALPYKLTK